ncbi:MAG: hypothetical protein R3B70_18050 [Polyangiaceae bacterium]
MGEKRDSSVLFSLKELMSLEEQRVLEEEAARDRARAAEAEARAQASRRAREEEEARLRLAEERRSTEEARRREEEAKLEAMRTAVVERARIEAVTRARMELLSKEQEQERVLAAIAHNKSGARRAALLGAGLAAAVVAAGLGVYYGKIKPESDRAELAAQAAIREQEEHNRKLKEEQDRLQKKIADAEEQMFQEKMKKATAMATAQPTGTPTTRATGTATVTPRKSACVPCADPSSPLCDGNGCELNR